jgi:hypothetical protein
MSAFLAAISAGDLGIFVEGEDFLAVQSMREQYRQEVTYRSAFGSDHPTIRTKRAADENVVSFSFILLKSGVQRGLNTYTVLRGMEDFEIQTQKGDIIETYVGVNWTSIDIDSGLDAVTVNIDLSVPGFTND